MEGKRRRRSKKTKKSWRKTDVRDVEEYLEEKRLEERTGGPTSDKTDKELFFVEKAAVEDGTATAEPVKSLGKRKRKPLRSEAHLFPNPAIVPFPSRNRKKKKLSVPITSAPVDSSSDEHEYDTSTTYAQLRKQRAKEILKCNPPKSAMTVATRDLWSDDAPEKVDIPDEHYLRVTCKKPVKMPKTLKRKSSALQSVELPHAGMSYNPTFEDHQDLLQSAVTVEEQRLKAQEKLEKRLQLAPLNHQQREKIWLEEMTEGLYPGEQDEEEEGDGGSSDGGDGGDYIKRPIRAENRKSKQQKRRERERKEEEQQKRLSKTRRTEMDEVYRLRSIRKEILKEEEAVKEKLHQRLAEEKEAEYQTKRLGRHVYQDADLEVQLSSEIAGALRCLKPEGSVAVDRYKSLQKRNIIEPREPVRPHRKYKLKVLQKRSARIPEDKTF